jgi:hypothetical protein
VQFPSIGSVASHQLTPKDLDLPGFISIGGTAQRIGPGFLGMMYAPFTIQNPGTPPENIRPHSSLGTGSEQEERINRRRRLFYTVEDNFRQNLVPGANEEQLKSLAGAAQSHSDIYTKAFSLVVSPRGKVFDLANEPASLQDEYGRNNFGRGCLLARKLVEAGVTAVEVDLGGWDLHNNTHATLSGQRLPVLDAAMGALVRDLNDRGLWKNTVLVWMGEFGRTPRINPGRGRDHWPNSWTTVLAGGGIKGGQAYGETSKDGMEVAKNPVTVPDFMATIVKALGIDPEKQLNSNVGRPIRIADKTGNPIKEIVG